MNWLTLVISLGISTAALASPPNRLDEIQAELTSFRPDIPEVAVGYAFDYFRKYESLFQNSNFITVIDFTASSRKRRMHKIDLTTGEVEDLLVAHGKNSGEDIATHFSNRIGSDMSSLGVYLTLDSYFGEHGLSLLLRGLESTNSNAETRAIVLHGAAYVTDEIAATRPRLGRSLGCPAVDLKFSEDLVKLLRGGSLIYAYSNLAPESEL